MENIFKPRLLRIALTAILLVTFSSIKSQNSELITDIPKYVVSLGLDTSALQIIPIYSVDDPTLLSQEVWFEDSIEGVAVDEFLIFIGRKLIFSYAYCPSDSSSWSMSTIQGTSRAPVVFGCSFEEQARKRISAKSLRRIQRKYNKLKGKAVVGFKFIESSTLILLSEKTAVVVPYISRWEYLENYSSK